MIMLMYERMFCSILSPQQYSQSHLYAPYVTPQFRLFPSM